MFALAQQEFVCPFNLYADYACCAADGAEAQAEEGHISDSVPTRFFSCPGAADFKVRGANYLADKKKASRSLRPCHWVIYTHLILHSTTRASAYHLEHQYQPVLDKQHLCMLLSRPCEKCVVTGNLPSCSPGWGELP